MSSICILGRQPKLGLAELESLYGTSLILPIGEQAAVLDLPPEHIDFNRLGGAVKLAQVLTTIPSTDWQKIEKYLIEHMPKHVCCIPEGKLVLGLSAYGLTIKPAAINATGLKLKKVVRSSGRPVRIVPNPQAALSSAQVLHNHLFTSHNWEILLIADGSQTYLAQTVAVQDIDAYTARDQARPKRDAHVGMLPPKLAQIVINLAVDGQKPSGDFTVLDPFCGTGVILQETLLMGYAAEGTDIDQRMIDYSSTNIFDWLLKKYPNLGKAGVALGDATNTLWETSIFSSKNTGGTPMKINAVASETYLGRAFTDLPGSQLLAQTIRECNLIIGKFLKNIHSQIAPGTRLCLAVPAWQNAPGHFEHLPLIDQLSNLGYNRVSFEHVGDNQLLYYREGQIVARQLLVLTRK